MTKHNLSEISKLWYHIQKSITGAFLNINQNISELILGIPPITIQTRINSIKHFLKIINTPVQDDVYKSFLTSIYNPNSREPKRVHNKIK